MSVIRVKHQTNYVVINKTVLEDKNLSFKAKGIWAYCMSRPDDWTFHVAHLVTVSGDGEKSIYSGLKELAINGYLQKVQGRDHGKFKKFDYEISEIKIILPHFQKRDAEKGRAEKEALLNNDLNQVMKENHPPLPPPETLPKDTTLKAVLMKKMILSGYMKEEFEEAWRRFKKNKDPVYHVGRWIESTLSSIRLDKEAKAEKALSSENIRRIEEISEQSLKEKLNKENELYLKIISSNRELAAKSIASMSKDDYIYHEKYIKLKINGSWELIAFDDPGFEELFGRYIGEKYDE